MCNTSWVPSLHQTKYKELKLHTFVQPTSLRDPFTAYSLCVWSTSNTLFLLINLSKTSCWNSFTSKILRSLWYISCDVLSLSLLTVIYPWNRLLDRTNFALFSIKFHSSFCFRELCQHYKCRLNGWISTPRYLTLSLSNSHFFHFVNVTIMSL